MESQPARSQRTPPPATSIAGQHTAATVGSPTSSCYSRDEPLSRSGDAPSRAAALRFLRAGYQPAASRDST